jgi:hypothetical protein
VRDAIPHFTLMIDKGAGHRHKNGPGLCGRLSPVVEDTHVWRQRQLDLNGGNGLAPVSIESL